MPQRFAGPPEEGLYRVGEGLRLDERRVRDLAGILHRAVRGAATSSGPIGRGRVSGRRARVKKALKFGQERGSGSTASERSTA